MSYSKLSASEKSRLEDRAGQELISQLNATCPNCGSRGSTTVGIKMSFCTMFGVVEGKDYVSHFPECSASRRYYLISCNNCKSHLFFDPPYLQG